MQEKKSSLDFDILKRVIALAKPYKSLMFWCLALAIALAPVATASPYIVKLMVDDSILTGDLQGLTKLAMIYIGLLLLNVIMRYQFIYSTALLGQSVIKDLRVRVFNHIINLKLRYFDQNPIGASTTRTMSDIEAINDVFTQGVITIVADLLTVITVIIIMFYTSWELTLICLVTLPFMILATYIFKEKVKVSFQNVRKELSNMNAFLQERISGMRIVQIFNAEKQEMEKFKKINRKYTDANLKAVFYYAIFFPVVELISAIGLALMVWFGAKGYLQDYVTFGALVAFPLYLDMLFRPVRMLADKFNTLQMGLVAADRVFKVLDDQSFIENKGTLKPEKVDGKVSFEHVYFAYDEENFVLKDINIDIPEGQTLAIVGSTGSGKTSIINILNRFYEIQKGKISIDGIAIQDYDLFALRKRIALVLQDVFLFNGTLYENITLKDSSISLETVIEASKIIGADLFFDKMPDAYNFKITERGNNLSVGQRQLISFVRALVFEPDILILDEATSSIDVETEAIIQHAIEKLIDKRTSIIIAHRLSTIQHANQIIVLNKGEIVERGTHNELLEIENGHYRELHEMQFNDVEFV
jgi:ATP-binding cassette subfamily B protein